MIKCELSDSVKEVSGVLVYSETCQCNRCKSIRSFVVNCDGVDDYCTFPSMD